MLTVTRTVQPSLLTYEEHELRAAHAELHAERRIALPYAMAMSSDIWKHFVYCRALDRRNREAAKARSRYVPAVQTDIRHAINRAMAARTPFEQRELELERDE